MCHVLHVYMYRCNACVADTITKLPESGDLCGNINEFGVVVDHFQSDIRIQISIRRMFCLSDCSINASVGIYTICLIPLHPAGK